MKLSPCRLITAKGFLFQEITGCLIGPCPATATKPQVLAPSTLALVTGIISKGPKHIRTLPDVAEIGLFQVPALEFEIAARLNDPDMGNKAKGRASQAAPGHGIQAVGCGIHFFAPLVRFLAKNPVVVGGAGSFQVNRDLPPHFIKPMKQLFILPGIDLLICHVFGTARRNKQKNVVRRGAEPHCQAQNLFNLIKVMPGNGRIDLKLHMRLLEKFDALEGPQESPLDFSEAIVSLRRRSIQGDTHALNSGGFHPPRHLLRDQGSICRHDHSKAFVSTIMSEFKHVLSEQRFPARENDNGSPDRFDLIEDPEALRRIQLSLIGPPAGCGPTVNAVQITVPRHLPGNETKLVFCPLSIVSCH
jgi:hypothetical protein